MTGTSDAATAKVPSGLFDRPVLVVDPGMHTGPITRADADVAGTWAVTSSFDKTVRIWSLPDGKLEQTIRLPAGPGNVGKAYAVAMSPDSALIAAGGWTAADPPAPIYLFDRASGALVKRIEGLPNIVNYLAFSLDGRRLVATLGSRGIRLYDRDLDWGEAARDENYGEGSYWATFAPDGRLATTARDAKLRLYATGMTDTVHPIVAIDAPDGHEPYGIAFNPANGTRLAIGYHDTTAVTLLDGHTLANSPAPTPRTWRMGTP